MNKDGKMKGPCETVSMINCNFKLESEGQCIPKGRSFTTKLGIKVTHNTISVDGWSIQYSCGHYMDSYLTINSPRDGRSQGLCGYYGKRGANPDQRNGNFLELRDHLMLRLNEIMNQLVGFLNVTPRTGIVDIHGGSNKPRRRKSCKRLKKSNRRRKSYRSRKVTKF